MQSSNYNHFTGKKKPIQTQRRKFGKKKTHAHIKTSILAFQRLRTSRKREYTVSENNSHYQGVSIMKNGNHTQNGNTTFMNHQIIIEEVQNETED